MIRNCAAFLLDGNHISESEYIQFSQFFFYNNNTQSNLDHKFYDQMNEQI